jgi:hypothetical protein
MATKTKKAPKGAGKKLSAKEKVQPPIPGAEQTDKVPAIHNAALNYADSRDAQVEATKERDKAADKLMEAMKTEGLSFYEHGNVTCKLVDTEKVKVKVKADVPPAE